MMLKQVLPKLMEKVNELVNGTTFKLINEETTKEIDGKIDLMSRAYSHFQMNALRLKPLPMKTTQLG